MLVDIKNRWTGSVIFTAEIEAGEDTCIRVRLGMAVKKAVKAKSDLRWAYLSEADLRWANLSEADLSGANLSGADLSEADLLAFGNMKELRTMQIDTWMIGYTADTLQIGCQRHSIDKWRKWDSDAGRKWIAQMDSEALDWAERNLALVLSIIDANPATPTGKEAENDQS